MIALGTQGPTGRFQEMKPPGWWGQSGPTGARPDHPAGCTILSVAKSSWDLGHHQAAERRLKGQQYPHPAGGGTYAWTLLPAEQVQKEGPLAAERRRAPSPGADRWLLAWLPRGGTLAFCGSWGQVGMGDQPVSWVLQFIFSGMIKLKYPSEMGQVSKQVGILLPRHPVSLPPLCPATSSSQRWDGSAEGSQILGHRAHSQRGPKGQCQAPCEPGKERPVRVFLDERNIWIHGPSKADAFPRLGRFHPIHSRPS